MCIDSGSSDEGSAWLYFSSFMLVSKRKKTNNNDSTAEGLLDRASAMGEQQLDQVIVE